MSNQPVKPEDREYCLRSIKRKPSQEDLAVCIYKEYIRLEPNGQPVWEDASQATQDFYKAIADIALNKFYHESPSIEMHCGYIICAGIRQENGKVIYLPIHMKDVIDVVSQDTPIMAHAVFNAVYWYS